MSHHKVIIIGGGISGLSAALALTKVNKIPANQISIHELRATASTIGGAVNLTPNALRYLDALGVYSRLQTKGCETRVIEIISHRTGGKLGDLSFDNERFGYRALRVKRGYLLEALLTTWRECGGIVKYESKISALSVEGNGVTASFADGSEETADLLLGCDGIHSWVRMNFVEPDRKPGYSGIAAIYGTMEIDASDREQLPMESTAAITTRRGTFMMSYCNPDKTELYVAAVMETKEEGSREGWRVKGSDQVNMKKECLERFGGQEGLPAKLAGFIERIQEWYLYPVYTLSPRGKWSKGPVVLLGDAAHAVRYPFPFPSPSSLASSTNRHIDAATRRKRRIRHRRYHALLSHPQRSRFSADRGRDRTLRAQQEKAYRRRLRRGQFPLGNCKGFGLHGQLDQGIRHIPFPLVDKGCSRRQLRFRRTNSIVDGLNLDR